MRYKAEHKQETRRRILEAVHRGFRQHGFSAAGVDGLAREAGVTSGAFYTHFNSKAGAFRECVVLGLEDFRSVVEQCQQQHSDRWLDEFTRFYLGEKRTSELSESCPLQSLTPEVARSDEATREVFETELLKAARSFAAGLPLINGEPNIDNAWVYLSMLVGGVTLARAVKDPHLADEIANAVHNAIAKKDNTE